MEGLPDWRMPAYYFRRMRKIGLAEGLAYLLGESSSPISFRAKVLFKSLFQTSKGKIFTDTVVLFCLIVKNPPPPSEKTRSAYL